MAGEPRATASPRGHAVRDDVVAPGEGWAEVVRQGQILRIVDQAGKHHQEGAHHLAHDGARALLRRGAADVHDRRGYLRPARHHRRLLQRSQQFPDVRGDGRARLSRDLSAGARPIQGEQIHHGAAGGPDGKLADTVFVDGLSRAGDFVDLRAEMDALAVISNCPQVNNPCTGLHPTPVRVVIWEPDDRPVESAEENY